MPSFDVASFLPLFHYDGEMLDMNIYTIALKAFQSMKMLYIFRSKSYQ